MQLAIFDLDHTLLNTDSDHSWGEFLVARKLVDPVYHRRMNDQFYEDYKAGQLDVIAYNEFVFDFFSRHDLQYLNALHQEFMHEVIRPQMRPEGFAAVARHKDLGHELLGISATNDFLTTPIFREFGIDAVIATTAELQAGRYTGKVSGIPCYQTGKLDRLQAWLAGREIQESWAYSDSYNDRFILQSATHAIAVNPDARLLQLAQQQDWPVQDWSI